LYLIFYRNGQKSRAQIFFLLYRNTLEELIFESYLVKKKRMDGLLDSHSHAFASGLKVKDFYDWIIDGNHSDIWNFSYTWIPKLNCDETQEIELCLFLNSLVPNSKMNLMVRNIVVLVS